MEITRTKYPKQVVAEKVINNPFLAIRALNHRRFFNFFKFFWPEYSSEELKLNWHIELLCDELQEMAERIANQEEKKYDLIVNIPPGTTKTAICSILFPAWCWTRWHWMRIIALSYSASLALESAEYSRDIIRSDRFKAVYPELEIKEDKDTKSNFRVVKKVHLPGRASRILHGGNRFSTSVGGSLTGFHGHILIVDDPLNPEQAISETELRNANRWMTQTLTTRKVDKAKTPTVLIMQRLHENDPSGHLLSKKKEKVKHICLPGELDGFKEMVKPVELVDKYVDGLLDPIRLTRSSLKELEQDLGQYGYAGQVGQSPTRPTGGMFQTDMFNIVETMPPAVSIERIVRYWDKAGTAEQAKTTKDGGPAYTVGTKMAKIKGINRFIVMDVKRGRWASNDRENIIRATAEADGRGVEVYHEQEPGSGGKESAEATTSNLAGFVVRADRPVGDKIYRADPYSVQVNDGNVSLLRAPWNETFVGEHKLFPLSRFKDQVDSAAGAFSKLVSKKVARVI